MSTNFDENFYVKLQKEREYSKDEQVEREEYQVELREMADLPAEGLPC